MAWTRAQPWRALASDAGTARSHRVATRVVVASRLSRICVGTGASGILNLQGGTDGWHHVGSISTGTNHSCEQRGWGQQTSRANESALSRLRTTAYRRRNCRRRSTIGPKEQVVYGEVLHSQFRAKPGDEYRF